MPSRPLPSFRAGLVAPIAIHFSLIICLGITFVFSGFGVRHLICDQEIYSRTSINQEEYIPHRLEPANGQPDTITRDRDRSKQELRAGKRVGKWLEDAGQSWHTASHRQNTDTLTHRNLFSCEVACGSELICVRSAHGGGLTSSPVLRDVKRH